MSHSRYSIAWRNGVWQVREGLAPLASHDYESDALADADWLERSAASREKREVLPISSGVAVETVETPIRRATYLRMPENGLRTRVPIIGAKQGETT